MTQEKKQLLLKDLCARLPYGVICYNSDTESDFKLCDVADTDSGYPTFDYGYGILETVKPYLRPISSMTEEEVGTLFNVLKIDEKRGDWLKVNDIGIIRLFTEAGKDFYEIAAAFDYLNSIHVDYRGLIEKGLALEALEGMYNKNTYKAN